MTIDFYIYRGGKKFIFRWLDVNFIPRKGDLIFKKNGIDPYPNEQFSLVVDSVKWLERDYIEIITSIL